MVKINFNHLRRFIGIISSQREVNWPIPYSEGKTRKIALARFLRTRLKNSIFEPDCFIFHDLHSFELHRFTFLGLLACCPKNTCRQKQWSVQFYFLRHRCMRPSVETTSMLTHEVSPCVTSDISSFYLFFSFLFLFFYLNLYLLFDLDSTLLLPRKGMACLPRHPPTHLKLLMYEASST